MSELRVLMVQKVKGIAGSVRYFLNIIPELQRRGVAFEFLILCNAGSQYKTFQNAITELNVPSHVVKISGFDTLTAYPKIKACVRKGNFNLIHSHLIHADFYMAMTRRFYGFNLPILSTKHGYDESFQEKHGLSTKRGPVKNRYFYFAQLAERYIEKSVSVSRALSDLFFEFGITPERTEVIHHGVPIKPETKQTQKSTSPFRIVTLGRLIPSKGVDLLLEVIDRLPSNLNFEVEIIGDGPELEILENSNASNKHKEKVKFLGYLPDPEERLMNANLMVLPSRGEGFGLVAIEAFGAQLPVMCFDVPALNEIVEHGKSGWVIPPFDTDKMAEELTSIITHPEKVDMLGRNAHEIAKSEFSLEVCAAKTRELYDSISA